MPTINTAAALEPLLPAGMRVERKTALTAGNRYPRTRRVLNGAHGTVTGESRMKETSKGAMRQWVQVRWDAPSHLGRGNVFWSLPEQLIPLD